MCQEAKTGIYVGMYWSVVDSRGSVLPLAWRHDKCFIYRLIRRFEGVRSLVDVC